jgi:sulfur relay (sulfurtransferase) complex TusBCD TusD component (DsrE family)
MCALLTDGHVRNDMAPRVLVILFSSPVQHREAEMARDRALSLIAAGYSVSLFLLGDGVYNASEMLLHPGSAGVVSSFAQMVGADIVCCSTCLAMRGVQNLIGTARKGGLEDLVDEMEEADIILNYTAEE